MINKVDRLVLELKLPPTDAYFKLRHTIEEVNSVLADSSPNFRISPELGNVCFASSKLGWCFSLKSFAHLYAKTAEESFDSEAFARRLWGDIYFDEERRTFKRTPLEGGSPRTFVHFILEPLYKLVATVIGEESTDLSGTLESLGIRMKASQLKMDVKPLLYEVSCQFFGGFSGLIDMCIDKIPSPLENAEIKAKHIYSGNMDSHYAKAMMACDPNGPLMVQIVKLYNADNMNSFDAFGRVMSGTLTTGDSVRVLGETYSPEDEEDMCVKKVSGLYTYESRYKIQSNSFPAGSWVLIAGVDQSIIKTATITDNEVDEDEPVCIFKPLRYSTEAVLKIAVEPVNPTELPKMLEGLRKVNKSYSILQTKVEESGEHIILGPGEMYLDCVMHDLRVLYSEIDIKIADPVVKFCETVVETSSIKCFAETPNKKNRITMICEPLEKGIAEDIENLNVFLNWAPKEVGKFFVNKYNWDILASRTIWAFGPDENSPNILMNDTLPSEVFLALIRRIKNCCFQLRIP